MAREQGHRSASLLPEIEGLRAVAVISVLVYHAHLGLSGGYVGVDVFFVVSGFLITGLLLREFESTGRISLSGFYARRSRRLLPAAALVLLTTMLLANRLLDPVRAHQNAVDTLYAGGFVANFHFAAVGSDYFQQSEAVSTLQHWWSLAVEEQFYVVWPGLLAVTWWLFGRRRGAVAVRASALTVIGVLGALSYVVGVRLTHSDPSWGYFATWSRGWELAAGAALAFVWAARERFLPHIMRALFGWIGIGLVAYAVLRLDDRTPFPGTAAWYPVAGTLLAIVSIGARGGPGWLLGLRPLQWIGGRSYGLYLWHWPLLVLLEARVEQPNPLARVGALAVSLAAAALSYALIENPVRHLPSLVRSAPRSLSVGAVLTVLVFGVGAVVERVSGDFGTRTGFVAPTLTTVADLVGTTTAAPAPSSNTGADDPVDASTESSASTNSSPSTTAPTPTTTLTPGEELSRRVETELQPVIAASAAQDLLPDNLRPPLKKAKSDKPEVYFNGCLADFGKAYNPDCIYGDPNGSTTIALFGDSHAAQWVPPLDKAGRRNGWKIVVLTKMGCPASRMSILLMDGSKYGGCDLWRIRAIKRIVESNASLVILTEAKNQRLEKRLNAAQRQSALEWTVSSLKDKAGRVLVLIDTPLAGGKLLGCIAQHPKQITKCNIPVAEASSPNLNRMSSAALKRHGGMVYDPVQWFCTSVCPGVIGDVTVYQDRDHVSRTYSDFLTPYVELLVKEALDRVGG